MSVESEKGEAKRQDTKTEAGRFTRIPLEAPSTNRGRPRMAAAIRDMTFVIRMRQNSLADFYDMEGDEYDWEKLKKKWYPGNGAYQPKTQWKPNGKN